MVLWRSGALVVRGHVMQVAAVLVPTVIQRLALKQSRGRGQVGDRGHGQVMVGWRARQVLLGRCQMGMMEGGGRVKLHVGKGVSDGARRGNGSSRRAETQRQRCRGGGRGDGGGPGAGGGGGRGGGEGICKDADRHGRSTSLQNHGAGDPETLLFVGFEHVGEAETLAAHVARVRLLARVCAAMALHVGPAGEALPTDLTNERLLSCTDRTENISAKLLFCITGCIRS